MFCASCHRRLAKPAAFSLGKPVGPKCAQRMGLIEPKKRTQLMRMPGEGRTVPVLPGQMALLFSENSTSGI